MTDKDFNNLFLALVLIGIAAIIGMFSGCSVHSPRPYIGFGWGGPYIGMSVGVSKKQKKEPGHGEPSPIKLIEDY